MLKFEFRFWFWSLE